MVALTAAVTSLYCVSPALYGEVSNPASSVVEINSSCEIGFHCVEQLKMIMVIIPTIKNILIIIITGKRLVNTFSDITLALPYIPESL